MPTRRYRLMTGLVLLLGVSVALAACAPFGEATPTAALPPTATIAPSPPPSATSTPAATAPAATATVAALPPTVAATTAATTVPLSMVPPPPPTAAIPAPTATVPAPPTLAPAATVPPPTAPTGASATDAQGRCAITLPAGFAASGGGAFSGANGQASITLTPLTAGASDTLDDVALPFVSTFIAATGDYQQTAVARGKDDLRLDFTGRMVAPGRGTIFLRQFGGTVCTLSFFVVQGGEVAYDQTVNALLASLRPAGAIGSVGARADRPDCRVPYTGWRAPGHARSGRTIVASVA